MRVVSLVPSWTESLIEAGVNVVGRTRYCIHPEVAVDKIPVVGGTKDYDWNKIHGLAADLLLVDKEENRQVVKEKSKTPLFVSHVTHPRDVSLELQRFSENFSGAIKDNIAGQALRWSNVLDSKMAVDPLNVPGVIQWVNRPTQKIDKIIYVIWKDPLMMVGKQTFIGGMLEQLGLASFLPITQESYPKFSQDILNSPNTLALFSSEPYDFGKPVELDWIQEQDCGSALIDGEKFSWFGVRSLKFLESLQS